MARFLRKKVITKCDSCALQKKNLIEIKKTPEDIIEGNGEILIIVDMIEYEKNYESLKRYLREVNVNNYTITHATHCRSKKYEVPSPAYKIFKDCNKVKMEKYNPKAIIAMGRSIYSLTKCDDLVGWYDFREHIFNQTYFYYEGIRVYPSPVINEWVDKDNFEKFYVKKQILNIKKYLRNYEKEKQKDQLKPYNIEVVEDPNKFLLQHLEDKNVSWDCETNSLDHFIKDFKIICLTMSFDGVTGYYLPFDKINKRVLRRFFSIEREYITANGKYDTKCLTRVGVSNSKITEDVNLLFHLLNTDRLKNSIKSLSWLIGFGGYEKDLDKYRKLYKIKDYSKIPKKILTPYAVLDAIVTYRLWEKGMELAKLQPQVYKVYKETFIPVLDVFKKMEERGMELDSEKVNKLNAELTEEAKVLKKEIQKEIGNIDINSVQQLSRALEEYGLPSIEESDKKYWVDKDKNKHYFYKTGVEILTAWESQGYEIASKLLKYRGVEKLKSSFVGEIKIEGEEKEFKLFEKREEIEEKGLVKLIRDDGLLHPVYSPGRASALRGTCSSPNIQQAKKDKYYRKIFKCPEDYLWWETDLDGFHLRICGILSGDPEMERLFNDHGDMHSVTSFSVFCRGIDKITIETEEGNKEYFSYEKVKVERYGKEIETTAGELKEGDDII